MQNTKITDIFFQCSILDDCQPSIDFPNNIITPNKAPSTPKTLEISLERKNHLESIEKNLNKNYILNWVLFKKKYFFNEF